MGPLEIALVGLATVVGLFLVLRRRRRRGDSATAAATTEAASPGDAVRRLRAATALSELRDMREALGPATHNRVERRRTPQSGAAPKIERRRKGTRRSA